MSGNNGSGKSLVISVVCIAEDSRSVASGFCEWMTECLQQGITPDSFDEIWEDFGGFDDLPDPGLEEYCEDCISEAYELAIQGGAERFTVFEDRGIVALVAVKGDPSAEDVKSFMLANTMNSDFPEEGLVAS